ncbi:MAG: T9SS type A sorting domain-containing protein [Ignavibacteriaceae bacterium]|jgi:hypothetical protein|nr:T9SS type A sorting domain-containing protein [Ignavibacteriaceae bacterium]MCW9064946.1 T9SS type A sorting domain-containing protein [Ignavibacteriaceae bacterium]
MKLFFYKSLPIIFFFLTPLVYTQDIEVIATETFLYEDTLGIEMVLDFEIINSSAQQQVVFEVRTLDSLPDNWTSSLCFGDQCFAFFVDSIAAEPPLFDPFMPGDTLLSSLHVTSDSFTVGTAYVQIQVGTFHNPNQRTTINFVATTDPTLSVRDNSLIESYNLSQNYPNPFNPSTKINYKIEEPGLVQLKVYNVLGVEVATLVDAQQNSGNYTADFNAAKLSSGVYFYSLSVNNFTQTRKMILEK